MVAVFHCGIACVSDRSCSEYGEAVLVLCGECSCCGAPFLVVVLRGVAGGIVGIAGGPSVVGSGSPWFAKLVGVLLEHPFWVVVFGWVFLFAVAFRPY